jgi:bifunctional DNase/RNase
VIGSGVRRARGEAAVRCSACYPHRVDVVSLTFKLVTLDPRDGRAVVIFVDEQKRCLPLWVDDSDAAALAGAARGDADSTQSPAALLLGVVDACGGAIDRVELHRAEGSMLRGVVVVDGSRGATVLPAKASIAAALAILADAPLLVDDGLVAVAHQRLQEAAERHARRSRPPLSTGVDAPVVQSTAERWSQTLQHLAGKIFDDRPS